MSGCEIAIMLAQLLKLTVNHQNKCMLVTTEPSPVACQKFSCAEVSSSEFLSSLPFRRYSHQVATKMKHHTPKNLKKTLTKTFKLLLKVSGEDGSYLNFSNKITSGHTARTWRLIRSGVYLQMEIILKWIIYRYNDTFHEVHGGEGSAYLRATARIFKVGVINTKHIVWNIQGSSK